MEGSVNYDDLVLSLEYVADHIAKDEMWPYEQSLRDAADAIQELQRDALRYRWLRDNPCEYGIFDFHFLCYEKLDAAIDEAMQQEQGRGTG